MSQNHDGERQDDIKDSPRYVSGKPLETTAATTADPRSSGERVAQGSSPDRRQRITALAADARPGAGDERQ